MTKQGMVQTTKEEELHFIWIPVVLFDEDL